MGAPFEKWERNRGKIGGKRGTGCRIEEEGIEAQGGGGLDQT